MFNGLGISLSGLDAASKTLYASASNIANARSAGSLDGSGRQAYQPIEAVSKANGQGGVHTTIEARQPAFVPSFDPDSPFANEAGLVAAPHVNLDVEIMNAARAEQHYKANALLIGKQQELADTLIESFDEEA